MVVGRGLAISSVGVCVGLTGAMLGDRVLSSLLYEVSPTDAVTLIAVGMVLIAVAIAATLIPARASTRIDPSVALRAEH
jgi:ABC-type antimicrobial peptide transport system permease subunit